MFINQVVIENSDILDAYFVTFHGIAKILITRITLSIKI